MKNIKNFSPTNKITQFNYCAPLKNIFIYIENMKNKYIKKNGSFRLKRYIRR